MPIIALMMRVNIQLTIDFLLNELRRESVKSNSPTRAGKIPPKTNSASTFIVGKTSTFLKVISMGNQSFMH